VCDAKPVSLVGGGLSHVLAKVVPKLFTIASKDTETTSKPWPATEGQKTGQKILGDTLGDSQKLSKT